MKWIDLVPEDGDAFVLLRNHGRSIAAYVRHGDQAVKLPGTVEVSYAEDPAPPLTPRHFTLRLGWNKREWAELDIPPEYSNGARS
jgi:hypothetical protein